jgi:hypothetical protein
MADLDPETLLPSDRLQAQAVDGDVRQIHRGQAYAEAGDTFRIDGTRFEVVEIRETTLGELTDADVQAEGADDLKHYKQMLERAHDNFEWDDDAEIVCHRFERR